MGVRKKKTRLKPVPDRDKNKTQIVNWCFHKINKSYSFFERFSFFQCKSISFRNDWNDINTFIQMLHYNDVQRFQSRNSIMELESDFFVSFKNRQKCQSIYMAGNIFLN